jgi:hypothetical protein
VLFLKNLKDSEIFLKKKGELKIFKCINVISADNLYDFRIKISDTLNQEDTVKYPLSDLIIRPRRIYFSISRSSIFRESEINLLQWLSERHLQTFIYLKKPVNNLEIGYIQKIDINVQELKENSINGKKSLRNSLIIKNIFGKQVQIPYKELDVITFEYNSALVQLKSETSLVSRLVFKVLKKLKPKRIIMP